MVIEEENTSGSVVKRAAPLKDAEKALRLAR